MRDLKGKKLLVISSDISDVSIVEAAVERGVFVIACDRYADWDRSPAKKMADLAWDIDYKETDRIAALCKQHHVDGVMAGYSEERVLAACRISRVIGSSFYATEEQIELTRNKKSFRRLCRQYGIPVPQAFTLSRGGRPAEETRLPYPVIVKPVDSGGRKGISICRSEEEFREALDLAFSHSLCGQVLVEEYVRGLELSAVYTIADGRASLSCLNDKFLLDRGDGPSILCNFVVTPSSHYRQYLDEIDAKVKRLLGGIGAENGVASFQFVADGEGIKAFEMGYRVNGNDDFKVIRHFNGIDFMKMLISHSLTGSMGDSLEKDDPEFPACAGTLILHVRAGTVGSVDLGVLPQHPAVYDISVLKRPGSVILDTGTNQHKAMMVKMTAGSLTEMAGLVGLVQRQVAIRDTEGDNMLLSPFDPERLKGSWSKS